MAVIIYIYICIYYDFLRCDAVQCCIVQLGRTCCLHLRPRIWLAAGSPVTLIPICQNTWSHVQEYHLFNTEVMKCKMNKDLESIFNCIFPKSWVSHI